jgi:hypothetical protein
VLQDGESFSTILPGFTKGLVAGCSTVRSIAARSLGAWVSVADRLRSNHWGKLQYKRSSFLGKDSGV